MLLAQQKGGGALGVGIYVTAPQVASAIISDNIVYSCVGRGIFIEDYSTDVRITNNEVYSNDIGIALNYTDNTVISGNNLRLNGTAIETGASKQVVILGNTVRGNTSTGITITGDQTVVISNIVSNNAGNGILTGATVTGFVIAGNRCFDDRTPKIQQYGVNLSNNPTNGIVQGNSVQGNLTDGIFPSGGAGVIIRDNLGYVTENSGTGTINSGATSAAITHGLSYTPVRADITVTLGENPTNTPGAIWVDTITSTQFTVNCENDPGASNLDFSWAVRKI